MSNSDEKNFTNEEDNSDLSINPSDPDQPTAVLDSSIAGGPFIPQSATIANDALLDAEMTLPPDDELIVEVELANGITDLDQALAASANFDTEADSPQESKFATLLRDHVLVEARQVFTPEEIERDEARLNALREETRSEALASERLSRLERRPSLSSFVRLKFSKAASASKLIESLKQLPEVTRAVVVPRAKPPSVPDDLLIGTTGSSISLTPGGVEKQWYLHRTHVLSVWGLTQGSGVVIVDIDWGCRTTHRDLNSAIARTYNAVDGSTNVTHGSEIGHGTAVLGIAGARAGNGGLAGYAPESILWAIQGDSGAGPQQFGDPWSEAIDFAMRTNAGGRRKVIMLEVQTSVGGNYEQLPAVNQKIRDAIDHGCVVCVAAGNGDRRADLDDEGQPFDPTGSILVGATSFDANENKRATFSNFGDRIVVSAPGDPDHDVTCGPSTDNTYRNSFGGTSGALPKVAGTVALMLSVNPNSYSRRDTGHSRNNRLAGN